MSPLDWGWHLGSSSGSNTATQSASTSGSDILATLLGQGPSTNAQTMATSDPASQPPPNPNNAPTVAHYGNNPTGYDTWQNGQANPNGTQDPNGRQTGGRYVDPTYQTDATGRVLTPDEQKYWRDYDVAKANYSTREHDGYLAYKAAQADAAGANGSKAVFDARTKTWSVFDPKAKTWADGISQADLLGKLSDDVKNEYPEWWWGQTADSAISGRANDLNGMAGQYAQQQAGGRQQYRYSTFGL